jgi:hypothetical protein
MFDTPILNPKFSAARRTLTVLVAAVALLVVPAAANAKDGDDRRAEVRVTGGCGAGVTSKLKVKSRDGGLEVEFEVEHTRSRVNWRVIFVHEGGVAWRGQVSSGRRGRFEVQRRMSDMPGADHVTVRGYGRGGLTCTATAILPG